MPAKSLTEDATYLFSEQELGINSASLALWLEHLNPRKHPLLRQKNPPNLVSPVSNVALFSATALLTQFLSACQAGSVFL